MAAVPESQVLDFLLPYSVGLAYMRTSIYAVWIFFENLGERTSIYAAKIVRRRRNKCSLYFTNDGFPIENRVIPNEISPNSRLRHIKSLWSIPQQMIYCLEYNKIL